MTKVSKTNETEFFLEQAKAYEEKKDFTQILKQEFTLMQNKQGVSRFSLQKELSQKVYKKLEDCPKTFERKAVEKWLSGTIPENFYQIVMIAHFFQREKLTKLENIQNQIEYSKQVEQLYWELNEKYLLPAKERTLYIRKKSDLALYLAWRFDEFLIYPKILKELNTLAEEIEKKDISLQTSYEEKNLHECRSYREAIELIKTHPNFYERIDYSIRKRMQSKIGPLDIPERKSSLRSNLVDLSRESILEICAIRKVETGEVLQLLLSMHMQGFDKEPWKDLEYRALIDACAARKREEIAQRMLLKNTEIVLDTKDYLRYHKIWKKNIKGKLKFCLCLGQALILLLEKGKYYNFYSVNYLLDRLVSSVYRESIDKLDASLLIKRLDKISVDICKNVISKELIKEHEENENLLKQTQKGENNAHPLAVYLDNVQILRAFCLNQLKSDTPSYFLTAQKIIEGKKQIDLLTDMELGLIYTQYLYVALVYSCLTGLSFWGSTMNGYMTYLKEVKELSDSSAEKKRAWLTILKIFRTILDGDEGELLQINQEKKTILQGANHWPKDKNAMEILMDELIVLLKK